jgi:putative component of membrane protein insertase Oxa1/YidC/SpoIIIJ protein YidD
MSNTVSLIVIPLLIAIFVLIIEYWIIQPIRNKEHKGHSAELSINDNNDPLLDHLGRLFRQIYLPNTYKLSSTLIRNIGDVISAIIPWLISSLLAFCSVVISIPLYIYLYSTEKFSFCKYEPSCKEYLVLAIESHGPVKGLTLGLHRFGRCSPLAKTRGKDVTLLKPTAGKHFLKNAFAEGNWKFTLLGSTLLIQILLFWGFFSGAIMLAIIEYLSIGFTFMAYTISIVAGLFLTSIFWLSIAYLLSLFRNKAFRRFLSILLIAFIVVALAIIIVEQIR